jgi:hypothetical protein
MRLTSITFAAALLLSAAPAFAHTSSADISGSGGNTAAYNGSTTHGDGSESHNGSVTGENGNSASRDATNTYSDGQVNHSATYTGVNGKTYNTTGTGE